MRPVQQIESSRPRTGNEKISFPIVFVGTWEQTWLNIASVPSDLADAYEQLQCKYDYMEQQGSNIISLTSATIPFFEHNCSPRNLFQCGLSKQSAGTQMQALSWRREAKLFRMYTPQKYISRTLPMDYLNIDDVSLGVNATIAVLCYTGYDLDDAVIINSTASERGMLNAGVTVAKLVDAHVVTHDKVSMSGAGAPTAATQGGEHDAVEVFQNLLATGRPHERTLDERGLPLRRVAAADVDFHRDHKFPPLQPETPVYCCALRHQRKDPLTGELKYEYSSHHVTRWRHFDKGEAAWIHSVIPVEFNGPDATKILLVFRIPRNPCIGDKFSARHGQKGTLPLQIRSLDLPFTASSGITPDVIINPHAFPSRMTVGMVFEIMAAKIGAVDGRFMDNSAWSTVDQGPRVAEDLGNALVRAGYNRYGREALICGISGEQMEADVFVGVCGYQRLRHMVNDKWQSRARTDSFVHRAVTKTGQPVKGRKRHGGVRVGEMERDGLLSHGIAEVVIDRLLHVSDKTIAFICTDCGNLLSIYEKAFTKFSSWKACRFCGAGSDETTNGAIQMVHIPQVLRLWVAELLSIGVRVTLRVK
jgi:DNA-directed RNA polymerase I subunit RPA2